MFTYATAPVSLGAVSWVSRVLLFSHRRAWGGIRLGVGGDWGMTSLYPHTFSAGGQSAYGNWTFDAFPADAVVVNLGTNDQPAPPAAAWIAAYETYVMVRAELMLFDSRKCSACMAVRAPARFCGKVCGCVLPVTCKQDIFGRYYVGPPQPVVFLAYGPMTAECERALRIQSDLRFFRVSRKRILE